MIKPFSVLIYVFSFEILPFIIHSSYLPSIHIFQYFCSVFEILFLYFWIVAIVFQCCAIEMHSRENIPLDKSTKYECECICWNLEILSFHFGGCVCVCAGVAEEKFARLFIFHSANHFLYTLMASMTDEESGKYNRNIRLFHFANVIFNIFINESNSIYIFWIGIFMRWLRTKDNNNTRTV